MATPPSSGAPATTLTAAEIDAVVRDHLPLVTYAVAAVAARVPRHVNRDDLVSAGMIGLLQAARTFDPARQIDFATFARPRIRGALIDELRSRDWATRSVRGLARKADTAVERLTARLQRTPTTAEVAAHLGVETDAVAQLSADVDRACVLNYDSIVLGGDAMGVLPTNSVDPESHIVARERCSYLYDAVTSLPERMRFVVSASFFEDRSSVEIAAELGVSESRVSQIRSEALSLLREGMEAQLGPAASAAPAAPASPADAAAAPVTKRKAAYFAAVASASDYRSRLDAAGNADVAERVALSGLG